MGVGVGVGGGWGGWGGGCEGLQAMTYDILCNCQEFHLKHGQVAETLGGTV